MKVITPVIFLLSATLPAANLYAEESDKPDINIAEYSNNYEEEIKANCQMEAQGLDGADQYIKDCIQTMKEAFGINE